MKECRRKSWYVFGTKPEEAEEKLVRYNIKPVGVYIRRYVVLLAWYGALSVRWERVLEKRAVTEERNKLIAEAIFEYLSEEDY